MEFESLRANHWEFESQRANRLEKADQKANYPEFRTGKNVNINVLTKTPVPIDFIQVKKPAKGPPAHTTMNKGIQVKRGKVRVTLVQKYLQQDHRIQHQNPLMEHF